MIKGVQWHEKYFTSISMVIIYFLWLFRILWDVTDHTETTGTTLTIEKWINRETDHMNLGQAHRGQSRRLNFILRPANSTHCCFQVLRKYMLVPCQRAPFTYCQTMRPHVSPLTWRSPSCAVHVTTQNGTILPHGIFSLRLRYKAAVPLKRHIMRVKLNTFRLIGASYSRLCRVMCLKGSRISYGRNSATVFV